MELPYTLKLAHPVTHGSETITELTYTRRPVAGDLRGIRLTELDLGDNIIQLTARLTSMPPSVISKVDFEDIGTCGEVLRGFLSTGQKTGSGPAE